jgi:ketosteroid isomerase-like protein
MESGSGDTGLAMSEENIEILRRAVEAFNQAGIAGAVTDELFADDVEFHEPPEQPAPRTARGREAVKELFGEFDAAWAEHKSEPEEFRVLADDRVLVLSVERFKGRDGMAIDAPFAAIVTVREGKIVEWQAFWDRGSALEAAGLLE